MHANTSSLTKEWKCQQWHLTGSDCVALFIHAIFFSAVVITIEVNNTHKYIYIYAHTHTHNITAYSTSDSANLTAAPYSGKMFRPSEREKGERVP